MKRYGPLAHGMIVDCDPDNTFLCRYIERVEAGEDVPEGDIQHAINVALRRANKLEASMPEVAAKLREVADWWGIPDAE